MEETVCVTYENAPSSQSATAFFCVQGTHYLGTEAELQGNSLVSRFIDEYGSQFPSKQLVSGHTKSYQPGKSVGITHTSGARKWFYEYIGGPR
jgi:hypothetical protein